MSTVDDHVCSISRRGSCISCDPSRSRDSFVYHSPLQTCKQWPHDISAAERVLQVEHDEADKPPTKYYYYGKGGVICCARRSLRQCRDSSWLVAYRRPSSPISVSYPPLAVCLVWITCLTMGKHVIRASFLSHATTMSTWCASDVLQIAFPLAPRGRIVSSMKAAQWGILNPSSIEYPVPNDYLVDPNPNLNPPHYITPNYPNKSKCLYPIIAVIELQ